MEVHFTPAPKRRFSSSPSAKVRTPRTLSGNRCSHAGRQARFVEGVKRGTEAADRGDLIEHDEVVARIDRLFQS